MDLGQIFTTGNVASYMVNLFTIPKDARIIEPCFGEGAFLRALTDSGYSEVDGYEIDRKLFDNVKNKYTKYNLVNADFLSCSTEQLYDGIIMNPPYIRHEKINDLKEYLEKALEQMINRNCTRVKFSERYKRIIDSYNAGGTENEEYYEQLVKLLVY